MMLKQPALSGKSVFCFPNRHINGNTTTNFSL